MTVTGYIVPSAAKTSVMPIFLPMMDFILQSSLFRCDIDVDAVWKIKLPDGIDGLFVWTDDVD